MQSTVKCTTRGVIVTRETVEFERGRTPKAFIHNTQERDIDLDIPTLRSNLVRPFIIPDCLTVILHLNLSIASHIPSHHSNPLSNIVSSSSFISTTIMSSTKGEKEIHTAPPRPSVSAGEVEEAIYDPKSEDDFEVFKQTTDGVQFRSVGWVRASVIFLKVIFATGVLSIPTAMYGLGAVGGALSVVGWGALNTCMFVCFLWLCLFDSCACVRVMIVLGVC